MAAAIAASTNQTNPNNPEHEPPARTMLAAPWLAGGVQCAQASAQSHGIHCDSPTCRWSFITYDKLKRRNPAGTASTRGHDRRAHRPHELGRSTNELDRSHGLSERSHELAPHEFLEAPRVPDRVDRRDGPAVVDDALEDVLRLLLRVVFLCLRAGDARGERARARATRVSQRIAREARGRASLARRSRLARRRTARSQPAAKTHAGSR